MRLCQRKLDMILFEMLVKTLVKLQHIEADV